MKKKQDIISLEEIGHVADLARLEMTTAELEKLAEDLNGILAHFQDIATLDTAQIEKVDHYSFQEEAIINHFRPDKPQPATKEVKKLIKDNFPQQEDDYLVVQSILKKK